MMGGEGSLGRPWEAGSGEARWNHSQEPDTPEEVYSWEAATAGI